MGKKQLGIRSSKTKTTKSKEALVYARPAWVKSGEEELCPDCFKVVGDKSRYNLVCLLGKAKEGMTVGQLTDQMQLRQPTISHHLNILRSVDA
ncbi:MAG: winged helix-turn-helix transcriptional regulator, partial [Candidatus Pacebacteria bacterium]|nr:winged helix-turn-helix transcriptional regulator [Candidatus Paceibacterota bacterium]